jgi:predicted metal-binding protein
MSIEELIKEKVRELDPGIEAVYIASKEIVFEERISLLCFHCKNYNYKFTCPPRIPKLDYRHIIGNEYQHGMLVFTRMAFTAEDYPEIRTSSTIRIHKALLYLEKLLFLEGVSTPLSFIGGSCKLCKTSCSQDKCNNPYHSRIPMEAAGINVVTTAKKVGIEISFPVKESLLRCGLILW